MSPCMFAFIAPLLSTMTCQVSPPELPPRFLASVAVCDELGLLVLGGLRGEHIPNPAVPEAFEEEAVAFRIGPDGTGPRKIGVGSGFILDASEPSKGAIFAVRRSPTLGAPERGYLVRSGTDGQTWDELRSAPSDIVGVAFASAEVGYAWSRNTVHRTFDSGTSWSRLDVPLAIPRKVPHPVVTSAGVLWLPSLHGSEWNRENNVLASVTPDLRFEELLRGTDYSIERLDADSDAIWLLVQPHDRTSTRLLRVPIGKGSVAPKLVAEFPRGSPHYLRAMGSDIVVLLSDAESSQPHHLLMASRDGGVTWSRQPLPEPRVPTLCALSASRIWMVGSSGKVYRPR
jgi:hypothetical protein